MPPVSSPFETIPQYPAERLCDRIWRDILNGVGAVLDQPVSYDDDDSDFVDPACNIKTDRFALAEELALTMERRAASAINEEADLLDTSVSSSEPSDTQSDAISTISTEEGS